jgi:hypothetical protein
MNIQQQKINSYKAGDLLYCKSRSNTVCCFHNHSCIDWAEINRQFGKDTAIGFLKEKVR